jgi:acyl transferase domain-containing protein
MKVQAFGYDGTNAHAVLDDAFHYLAERKLQGIHFTESTTPIDLCDMPTIPQDHCHVSINPGKDPMKLHQAEIQKRIRLFIFSAQDQDGLNRQRESFSKYVRDRSLQIRGAIQPSNHYLRNLAFTLSKRRSRLAWKMYMTASSIDELLAGLQNKSSEMPSFVHQVSQR